MTRFNVPDMSCGSCAQRISRALAQAGLPEGLHVEIDVAAKQVRLAAQADARAAEAVRSAIALAGYTPQPVSSAEQASKTGGCCCAARRASGLDVRQSGSAGKPACCQ